MIHPALPTTSQPQQQQQQYYPLVMGKSQSCASSNQGHDSNSDDVHRNNNPTIFLAVVEWEEEEEEDDDDDDDLVKQQHAEGEQKVTTRRNIESNQHVSHEEEDATRVLVVRRTKLRFRRCDWRTMMAESATNEPLFWNAPNSDTNDHNHNNIFWQTLLSQWVMDKIIIMKPNGRHHHHHNQRHNDTRMMMAEIYDTHQSDYVSLQHPSEAACAVLMACRRRGGCDVATMSSATPPMLVRLRLVQQQPPPPFQDTAVAAARDRTTRNHSCADLSHSSDVHHHRHHHQNGLLALTGRYIPYHYGMDYSGTSLYIQEQPNNHGQVGTGGTIWDGAMVLAKYIESHPETVVFKSVLELGSGTGLVGIAAGLMGATEVLLTDLAYCLPLIQENIHRHASILLQRGSCHRMDCRVLDWYQPPPATWHELLLIKNNTSGSSSHGNNNNNNNNNNESNLNNSSTADLGSQRPTDVNDINSHHNMAATARSWKMDQENGTDVIVIADCVWVKELVAPLLSTLQDLLKRRRRRRRGGGARTKVYISYQRRGKDTHEAFWAGLQALFSSPHHSIVRLDIMVDPSSRLPPDVFYLWECCY